MYISDFVHSESRILVMHARHALGKMVFAGLGGLGGLGAGVLYASSFSSENRTVQAAQKISSTSTGPAWRHSHSGSPDIVSGRPSVTKWDYNWDRRDPSSLVEPSKGGSDDLRYEKELAAMTPNAVRHLFLIRHGQYNLDGLTDKERSLTETGVEQAITTGKRLATLNFPYQQMVRSTMTRAQQTGTHILSQMGRNSLPVRDDNMLEEGAPCPPEPPHFSYSPLSHEYFQDGSRIEAAFRNYVYRADPRQTKDSYDIIVCHGNVIRYFVCRALQLPPEAWLRIDLRHASITWLSVYPNGGVSLRCLGDSGHLPPRLVT